MVNEKVQKDNMHSGILQTLAGVGSNYWIPQGRSLVKAVLSVQSAVEVKVDHTTCQ